MEIGVSWRGENPLKNVYGGIILGSTSFIKGALDKIEQHLLEREGISCRRELGASFLVTDVLDFVSRSYDVEFGEIESRKELRKKVLYLLKKHTSAANSVIGDLVGMSSAATAKAYQRYVEALKQDKKMRKEIETIEAEMSRVKPCPLFLKPNLSICIKVLTLNTFIVYYGTLLFMA